MLAFRTGTNAGIYNFGGTDYVFSSYNDAEWGYANGYASVNPTVSTALNLGGLASNIDAQKSWLGFTQLFGSNPGQIPTGNNYVVDSATLVFSAYSVNAVDVGILLHRVINDDNQWFGESPTWVYQDKPSTADWLNSGGSPVARLDLAAAASTESAQLTKGAGSVVSLAIDVTDSLNAWIASDTGDDINMGWGISAGANTPLLLYSPSVGLETRRPVLLVNFRDATVPEPGSLTMMLVGAALFRIAYRYRRTA